VDTQIIILSFALKLIINKLYSVVIIQYVDLILLIAVFGREHFMRVRRGDNIARYQIKCTVQLLKIYNLKKYESS